MLTVIHPPPTKPNTCEDPQEYRSRVNRPGPVLSMSASCETLLDEGEQWQYALELFGSLKAVTEHLLSNIFASLSAVLLGFVWGLCLPRWLLSLLSL